MSKNVKNICLNVLFRAPGVLLSPSEYHYWKIPIIQSRRILRDEKSLECDLYFRCSGMSHKSIGVAWVKILMGPNNGTAKSLIRRGYPIKQIL